jgi:hypothetical protein
MDLTTVNGYFALSTAERLTARQEVVAAVYQVIVDA